MFSFFLLPFVFIVAMLPQNIMQMYDIIESVSRIGLVITIVYPSLLLIVAVIRGKREDRNEGKAMDKPS
jgi:spore germination protein